MSQVIAKNLTHRFGDKLVLDNINLEIKDKEFLSFVGASGCGKSTFLRLIANLLTPSSGSIESAGREDLKISMVFQDANLLPWLNVLRNVSLPLKLKGLQSDKPMEWLEKVGLADSAKLYPDELSGGMKMRVAMARAMAMEPDLLLLDEPFGALDEITRQEMGDALLKFREYSQCTAIFVTHSVAEAVYLSERVALMAANPGRILKVYEIAARVNKNIEWRTQRDYLERVADISKALHGVIRGGHVE
jgi:NitT/TauT family transport system ATP-binding protein